MFTVTFGSGKHSVQTVSQFVATTIAHALAAKGWGLILVTDPDGERVDWRL